MKKSQTDHIGAMDLEFRWNSSPLSNNIVEPQKNNFFLELLHGY